MEPFRGVDPSGTSFLFFFLEVLLDYVSLFTQHSTWFYFCFILVFFKDTAHCIFMAYFDTILHLELLNLI